MPEAGFPVTGSSPHTRGAPVTMCGRIRSRGIIPAYAGSTSRELASSATMRDHPRIRGEHAVTGSLIVTRSGIIPAYAGSTARPVYRAPGDEDHPRIRGEHDTVDVERAVGPGSSPHTRGARGPGIPSHEWCRIIPAYAGSTSPGTVSAAPETDHPRIRGEHAERHRPKGNFTGSSPHTRGARRLRPVRDRRPGIIPAYAGSTQCYEFASSVGEDHPRIRGEHNVRGGRRFSCAGSSPHTRGARPLRRPVVGHVADHPRIRGEHPTDIDGRSQQSGSSPHTRGARARLPPGRPHPGIIPAYAGSTPTTVTAEASRGDHPRIRGEHVAAGILAGASPGSSPHTRGAPMS